MSSLTCRFLLAFLVTATVAVCANCASVHGKRNGRAEEVTLTDPLDCMSTIVCGLWSNPPQKPTLFTSTMNDYAYLLKTVLTRVTKYKKKPDDELFDLNSGEYVDSDAAIEDWDDPKAQDFEDEKSKEDEDEEEDEERDRSDLKSETVEKIKSVEKNVTENSKDAPRQSRQEEAKHPLNTSPFQRIVFIRVSDEIGNKLRNSQKCGLVGNVCPFHYPEMMKLISGVIQRKSVVSQSGDRVLPMMGFLIRSRNQTATLIETFGAIDIINNITLAADRKGSIVSFPAIYDEILEIPTGTGLQLANDQNQRDTASTVWHDDEFDDLLKNPTLQITKIEKYLQSLRDQQIAAAIKTVGVKRTTPKPKVAVEDKDPEDEVEDSSEEGLDEEQRDKEVDYESNEESSENPRVKIQDDTPTVPPVFGTINSLRKL